MARMQALATFHEDWNDLDHAKMVERSHIRFGPLHMWHSTVDSVPPYQWHGPVSAKGFIAASCTALILSMRRVLMRLNVAFGPLLMRAFSHMLRILRKGVEWT